MRTRWVWVDPETLAETDFKIKPEQLPTLRVEIISATTEKTLTYNTPDDASVVPPGAGWVFKEIAGFSSVWVRIRQTIPRHEPARKLRREN